MANVFLRTDELREAERCGGCDCFEGVEGCECREVCCNICGKQNHIYNMSHPDKDNDDLWNDLSFEDKLNGFTCPDCGESDEEDCVESSQDDDEEEY